MNLLENLNIKFDDSIFQVGKSICNCQIKFTDEHLLLPSLFPNGTVCGHLHEIRSINFSKQNNNKSYRKINVKPVNLKIKSR